MHFPLIVSNYHFELSSYQFTHKLITISFTLHAINYLQIIYNYLYNQFPIITAHSPMKQHQYTWINQKIRISIQIINHQSVTGAVTERQLAQANSKGKVTEHS